MIRGNQIKLPFKVEFKYPFKSKEKELSLDEIADIQKKWLESIKANARGNIENGLEYLRIAWTNRFKIPKYSSYDLYTDEELLLEMWEQFYYENPDHLELQGLFSNKNKNTGYKFYKTGDPVLDELEEAFGRGETPDIDKALGHIKGGVDIFRSEVFIGQGGEKFAPKKGIGEVKLNEKGEKITEAGNKIEHEDYSCDDWLENAFKDDPVLKTMAERMGVSNA